MPRKKESPYNIVVGRKRKHDVRLQIQVSANTAAKLKEMAIGHVIPIPEQDFLEALELAERPKCDVGVQITGTVSDMGPIRMANGSSINFAEAAPKENILEEAARIIYGDRENAYGNPRFNLDTIAQFWNTYLDRKFPENVKQCGAHNITAEDVAQLMILLKTSRLIHNPVHRDSLVDQAGYAALQERIQPSKV